ncbi:hypothetical protein ACOMHN_064091 [Nucella lapillus]
MERGVDSPYRDKLSMAILELQENGKIQLLYKKWWKDTGDTCVRDDDSKSSKANALGVENVGGIFVVLMGGLALAVLVAICEFLWRSGRNARADRTSLCSEMAQEMRFAVRCIGSGGGRKPRTRPCSICRSRDCDDPSHRGAEVPLTRGEPANGSIQLREVRRSPGTSGAQSSRRFETEFARPRDFAGEYLHVEYSDGEV